MSDPVSTPATASTSSSMTPSTELPSPRPQRGGRWKIIVPVVAVIVLLAGGGAYAYHRHTAPAKSHKNRASARTTPKPATFTLPDTVDGLPKSTDEQTTALATATVADLTASLEGASGDPVVGVYGNTSPDAAILVGLPATPTDVDAQNANILDALRSTQFFDIPDPTTIDAGRPGAVMQCADGSVVGGVSLPVGVCAVSDRGGSVLVLRLTKASAETADITKALLPAFETP